MSQITNTFNELTKTIVKQTAARLERADQKLHDRYTNTEKEVKEIYVDGRPAILIS